MGAWIDYYNGKRPHSSHGLMTPGEAYDTHIQYLKAAA
ncbi:integrase core domain-containing protein [Pseudoruegeria sp. SK021]